jgi:hypothetical protein
MCARAPYGPNEFTAAGRVNAQITEIHRGQLPFGNAPFRRWHGILQSLERFF